jgi:PAS domain S-box-containing protein
MGGESERGGLPVAPTRSHFATSALALVEAAPDAMLVVDERGRIVLVNAQAERVFGYPRAELIGQAVELLVPAVSRGAHAESRHGYLLQPRTRAMGSTGQLLFGRRKDGTEFRAEISLSPLRTDEGHFAIAGVRDCTERLRAEEAVRLGHELRKRAESNLHEVTSFLDSIVENIPLMVFVKDAAELRFERFNRAGEELLGVRRDELVGKNDFDLFPAEQAEFFQTKDRETLELGEIVDILEEPIQTPGGERWLHTRKVVIADEQGKPRHLLGISEDVTERRDLARRLRAANEDLERRVLERTADLERANQELRRAQEEREDLLRALSHDLRSPLSVIHLKSQLLARRLDDPDTRRELAAILTSTGRMEAMIAELVEAVRLESTPTEPKPIELPAVLRELLARTAGVLAAERIEVALDDAPRVLVDPAALERILTNLLSNALKYSPPETKVRVTAERRDAECAISVVDRGPGIPEEDVSHLFERFWRARRTARADGLGLGLFIVSKLVVANGGRIWVESELGVGSSFWFTLPLAR